MVFIGHVQDLPSLFFPFQEIGTCELIQFFSHGVGGNTEFFRQFAKIGPQSGIEKKAHQEFDPSL